MTHLRHDRRHVAWLSSPNVAAAEILRDLGYGAVVLDIEHGSFDLDALDRFTPLATALRLEVLAKVLGPERGPIQQALDFGASAVVVPHITSARHAAQVCAFGKFSPLGDRSFAGGRTAGYGAIDDRWVDRQNTETKVYPMVEDSAALEEVSQILALPTVDGIFVGPSDLSLSRGRGAYRRSNADFADLQRISAAADAAGKPWIMPAWSTEEKRFAIDHGADQIVLTMEHGALGAGLQMALSETVSLRDEQHRPELLDVGVAP